MSNIEATSVWTDVIKNLHLAQILALDDVKLSIMNLAWSAIEQLQKKGTKEPVVYCGDNGEIDFIWKNEDDELVTLTISSDLHLVAYIRSNNATAIVSYDEKFTPEALCSFIQKTQTIIGHI